MNRYGNKSFAEIRDDPDALAVLVADAVGNAKSLYPRLLKALMRGSAGGALFSNDDFLQLEALEWLHDSHRLAVTVIRFFAPQRDMCDELAAEKEDGAEAEGERQMERERE